MMQRKFSLIVTAAFFGFMGGWLSTYLLSPTVVTAQVGARFPLTTTGLTIINQAGQPRASLTLWDGEHPALTLSDNTCDRRASLIVAPEERVALTLFGKDCKRRVALEVQADDMPTFVLRDSKDTPRARLHLLADGSPVLALYDANGRPLHSSPDVGEAGQSPDTH